VDVPLARLAANMGSLRLVVARMSDLLLIVPTRGRPENASRLAGACAAIDIDLVFGVDDDDPERDRYLSRRWPSNTRLTMGQRLGMCGTLNAIAVANAHRYALLGFCGDDHLPHGDHWPDAIRAALSDRPAFCYGDDLFQRRNLPTAVFLTSDIVQALGYMAPPTLRHMYLDNTWKAWGEAIGRLHYLPDVVIEHVHPHAGKGEADQTYSEVWPLMEPDRVAFNHYCEGGELERDVEKLREAMRASSAVR